MLFDARLNHIRMAAKLRPNACVNRRLPAKLVGVLLNNWLGLLREGMVLPHSSWLLICQPNDESK